jgi:hypothetical protein
MGDSCLRFAAQEESSAIDAKWMSLRELVMSLVGKTTNGPPERASVVWLRGATILIALAALWAIYQIVWMAVSAAVGVGVLAVIGVVGVAGFQALPMLAQKWENRILAARKQEARKNPIEQAENEYLRRSQQYAAFKTALESIGAQVISLRGKLDKTRREKPNYDLRQESAACDKMELFYQDRKNRLQAAGQQLVAFKDKIDEAKTKWDFQLAANQAIRAMNATDRESKLNEILTEVAFDSVQQNFDAVFARLDVDAVEITSKKELAFGAGMTLDLSGVEIAQTKPAELR